MIVKPIVSSSNCNKILKISSPYIYSVFNLTQNKCVNPYKCKTQFLLLNLYKKKPFIFRVNNIDEYNYMYNNKK
jgi:hypothetical protein